MAAIAPVLPPFRDVLTLRRIDVYGDVNDAVREMLGRKVELLGGTLTVHARMAGLG